MAGAEDRRAEVARHRELLDIETALWAHGLEVAGLDEAGMGPLAGSVVAACVVVHPSRHERLVGVFDSKALSEERREALAETIKGHATAWAVGRASVQEIDRVNIREAANRAMVRALEACLARGVRIDHLLVDARRLPGVSIAQSAPIKGDAKSLSIAAASILAKVERDREMVALHRRYPDFGFDQHKGYGTRLHRERLERLGPCPAHRRSFAPVARWVGRKGAADDVELV